jgi:hypothetical protein
MPSAECKHEIMRTLSTAAPVHLVGPGELKLRHEAASIFWCQACGTVLVETPRPVQLMWLLPTPNAPASKRKARTYV